MLVYLGGFYSKIIQDLWPTQIGTTLYYITSASPMLHCCKISSAKQLYNNMTGVGIECSKIESHLLINLKLFFITNTSVVALYYIFPTV